MRSVKSTGDFFANGQGDHGGGLYYSEQRLHGHCLFLARTCLGQRQLELGTSRLPLTFIFRTVFEKRSLRTAGSILSFTHYPLLPGNAFVFDLVPFAEGSI